MAQPRFGKRRWRRPERMTLEDPHVVRRKDLGVSEPLPVEPELARKISRRQMEILLGSFAALCAVEGALIGLAIGHPFLGTIAAIVVGVVYFFVAREFGDGWIVKALRAEPAEGIRVLRLVSSEARTAGIPAPRALVAPGDVPNGVSFALRRRWLVTTAACEELDELALEGLIAHEIVHLRDGDASVASLYLVLAGSPELVFRGSGALVLLSIPLWPVAFALRALRSVALPASREHRADVAAAMLTRYPPGIVAALEAAGGTSAGLRPFDGFWFAPRDAAADKGDRAALIAEM
jgi:Zn-dependent protease with chaperone function